MKEFYYENVWQSTINMNLNFETKKFILPKLRIIFNTSFTFNLGFKLSLTTDDIMVNIGFLFFNIIFDYNFRKVFLN